MSRIFLVITLSIMLLSCSDNYLRKNANVLEDNGGAVHTDMHNQQAKPDKIVVDKQNDIKTRIKTFNSAAVKNDFFSEYRVSPNDELDLFLSTKDWDKDADYEVINGDTLVIKFKYASKYDVSPKISQDGRIILPFVGVYRISGKSTLAIQQDLIGLYSKVFRKPELKVTLPEYLTKIRALKNEMHTANHGLRHFMTVRADGYTVLPLVGEYQAAGKTLNQITKEINAEYLKINPMFKADLFLK